MQVMSYYCHPSLWQSMAFITTIWFEVVSFKLKRARWGGSSSWEGLVEVEAKTTIVTHSCWRLARAMGRMAHHPHDSLSTARDVVLPSKPLAIHGHHCYNMIFEVVYCRLRSAWWGGSKDNQCDPHQLLVASKGYVKDGASAAWLSVYCKWCYIAIQASLHGAMLGHDWS